MYMGTASRLPSDMDIDKIKSVFKAYDIRGIAGNPLTNEFAYRLGKSFAKMLKCKRIAVGRDIRESGSLLQSGLNQGLLDSGVDVIDLGVICTGTLYHATNVLDVDGGVMVTASHNPPEYNGFKMTKGISAMAGSEIQDLLEVFVEGDFLQGEGTIIPKDHFATHLEDIVESIEKPKRGVKVVIDCGNAVAGPFMISLLESLNCEVIPLYCDWDNSFPNHPPDPTRPKNMQDLSKKVVETNSEFGIGVDGDGDRIGIVDESGLFIHPDRLLGVFANDILSALTKKMPIEEYTKEELTIIYDVKCSMSLEYAIESAGGIPLMLRTGHSFQKQALREMPSVALAGEMSGHFFFNDSWYGFDDSLYVAARLIELVSRRCDKNIEGRMFSDLFSIMPTYANTGEAKVPCPQEEKEKVMNEIISEFNKSNYELNTVDGIRSRIYVDGEYIGWFLCRPSNTEPILVMRAEAMNQELLQYIKSNITDMIGKIIDLENFLKS